MDDELIVTLINEDGYKDDEGYMFSSITEKDVFAKRKSVSRTEFYQAMRSGRKITETLIIDSSEYSGQSMVKIGGKMFSIERTFSVTLDLIQLNCSEVIRNG